MKRKGLFIPVFLIFVLFACKDKNPIVGTWKLNQVNLDKAISVFEDEQKEFAKIMMQEAFENVKGKLKMTFKENHSYQIETPLMNGEKKKESGTWKLSKNHKKLILITPEGEEQHQILRLTDNLLLIEMSQDGFGAMEMTFIPE